MKDASSYIASSRLTLQLPFYTRSEPIDKQFRVHPRDPRCSSLIPVKVSRFSSTFRRSVTVYNGCATGLTLQGPRSLRRGVKKESRDGRVDGRRE